MAKFTAPSAYVLLFDSSDYYEPFVRKNVMLQQSNGTS
jgi:hypothetical protein